MQSKKIRYEDFKKLADFLEDKCQGSYINISIKEHKIIFRATTSAQENIEVVIWEDDSHMLPKKIIEELL